MTRVLLACSVVLVTLSSCADAPRDQVPEAAAQLDFVLPELSGGQVVGAELAGQHVAMWFWTPW